MMCTVFQCKYYRHVSSSLKLYLSATARQYADTDDANMQIISRYNVYHIHSLSLVCQRANSNVLHWGVFHT